MNLQKYIKNNQNIRNKETQYTQNILDTQDTQDTQDTRIDYNLDKTISLVKDSLEFYDKGQEKYRDIYKNINYISIEINTNDLEHNIIIFYDLNFKELSRHKFERIGIFDIKSNLWTWAWAIPFLEKNETNIIRKILTYGVELDLSSISLKVELITSRFKITNKVQLDIHCAIASYLSKKQKIFSYKVFGSTTVINNKFIDILNLNNNNDNDNYELISYIFLLD
jgi:hypothetical protein